MDLYMVPNNPEHTILFSANGVAHYHIQTTSPKRGPRITVIKRPSDTRGDTVVAEIEWKSWDSPTVIRSPLLEGPGPYEGTGVPALHFLYKRHRFSPSRYFFGDDAFEYRWKAAKGVGCVLTCPRTNTEVARAMSIMNTEGAFAREKRSILRIQPCSLDIDLIVLTFIFMEKKRRDRDGFVEHRTAHDEEPQGDGGGSGDGGDGLLMGEL